MAVENLARLIRTRLATMHQRKHIFEMRFGDQGTNYFPRWREFIHESVFLLTEALTPGCGPSCYQPWKDVIIPGHTDFFRCAASGGGQIEHMRWPNVR